MNGNHNGHSTWNYVCAYVYDTRMHGFMIRKCLLLLLLCAFLCCDFSFLIRFQEIYIRTHSTHIFASNVHNIAMLTMLCSRVIPKQMASACVQLVEFAKHRSHIIKLIYQRAHIVYLPQIIVSSSYSHIMTSIIICFCYCARTHQLSYMCMCLRSNRHTY